MIVEQKNTGGFSLPKERPILFSAPMVRALLNCTKSQTRRVLNPQPQMVAERTIKPWNGDQTSLMQLMQYTGKRCPYGQSGDRLWVREAWAIDDGDGTVLYRADDNEETRNWDKLRAVSGLSKYNWKPSIHMFRRYSRTTLQITGVRIERLQDISEEDAKAEGMPELTGISPIRWYTELWETINGAGSWSNNPWVWVVEFKII